MIVAKFVGSELCVVVGSVCSLLCTILLGSKIKPNSEYEMKLEAHEKITVKKALTAWSPFIFIFQTIKNGRHVLHGLFLRLTSLDS